ncbi:MAG TPA: GGDEF domain-containing protein [Stellaceae bacterium]|nr:GGDEF domain-containing protein [Stellaceae bacterium]
MNEEPDRADDTFSLFGTEERVIAEAEAIVRQLQDVARGVGGLADSYRRSCREQQRLVRLSDRMQHELQSAKSELAEQARSLLALNEVLRSESEQRRLLSDELFRMAMTDPLTGASSRRHLFELGNYEIGKTARSGDPLTALLVDLDHFKSVNDAHGHIVGDEALKRFAELSMTLIRKTDVFARYGGEEFVLLLPGTTTERGLEIAERLRQTVAGDAMPLPDGEVRLTVSVGVASLVPGDTRLEELLTRADRALYEAKAAGRDCVVVDRLSRLPAD